MITCFCHFGAIQKPVYLVPAALLLLDLVRRHSLRTVTAYSFRGRAPLFDLAPFRVTGRPDGNVVALEATAPDGTAAMTATATLADR